MLSIDHGPLGYLLRQAYGIYRLKMEKALAEFNITAPQFTILKIVDAYPNCSNADVARLSLLTPQTVSLIISKLANLQLVQKISHPFYKKIQQIEITNKGKDLLAQCSQLIDILEDNLETHFSKQELITVRKWLKQVIED